MLPGHAGFDKNGLHRTITVLVLVAAKRRVKMAVERGFEWLRSNSPSQRLVPLASVSFLDAQLPGFGSQSTIGRSGVFAAKSGLTKGSSAGHRTVFVPLHTSRYRIFDNQSPKLIAVAAGLPMSPI